MGKHLFFNSTDDYSNEHFHKLVKEKIDSNMLAINKRLDKANDRRFVLEEEISHLRTELNQPTEIWCKFIIEWFKINEKTNELTIKEFLDKIGECLFRNNKSWIDSYQFKRQFISDETNRLKLVWQTYDSLNCFFWAERNISISKNPRDVIWYPFELTDKNASNHFNALVDLKAALDIYYLVVNAIEYEEYELSYSLMSLTPNGSRQVTWTGSNKRDQGNEFIKLIYALHQGRYLNNGKGNITNIVTALARSLNFDLPKSWNSNLHHHLDNKIIGHDPIGFFDDLKESFEIYLKHNKK